MKKSVDKKPKTRMSQHTLKVLSLFKGQEPLSNKDIFVLMKKFKPDVTGIWVCATICNLARIKLIKRVRFGVYRRTLKVPTQYSHLIK